MVRRLVPILALLAALVTAAPARAVRVDVGVRNAGSADVRGWSVRATLPRRGTVQATKGTRVRRSGRRLTLTRRGFRVLESGQTARMRVRVPAGVRGWRVVSPAGSRTCGVTRASRRSTRLRVACRLGTAPAATPDDGPGDGGGTPGGGGTGGGSTGGGGSAGGLPVLPYVDMAAYPPPELATMRADAGLDGLSVGFVTARGGKQCVPTWGGYADYPASGDEPYRLDDVKAAGAASVVSFGGAAGVELARACPTADALLAAYRSVLAAYGAKAADFDVEGEATMADTAATARRNQALAALAQDGVAISFTLAVTPAGLDRTGVELLQDAQAKGLRPAVVNVMAMDYGAGAAPDPAGRMGDYAIQSGESTLAQLQSTFPGAGPTMLGVTPMIGINDVSSEVFQLADATKLRAWATRTGIGRLAMWQLARDRRCDTPKPTTQETCSGVDQAPYAFARALSGR